MPTSTYGDLPPPGVWHDRGQGSRKDEKALIGIDFVANAGNDFLMENSFFSNSGAQVQSATRPKELHLDVNLVPLAQPSAPSYGRNPPGAPGMRLSAHRFEDMTPTVPITITSAYSPSKLGAFSADPGGAATPQRMCVDGQWRLSSSLSSSASTPNLHISRAGARHPPDRQQAGDIGKQFVHSPSKREFLNQNRALADARVAQLQQETRVKREGERSALGDWRSRWGFEATPGVEFSRSRRKPFEVASKPTLQGFVGLQM